MEIRARLQAYFGAKAVDRWALVGQYVTSALSVAYGGSDGEAVIPNPWVSQTRSPSLELVFRRFLDGDDVFEALEIAILSETERLTSSLLEMHVQGYSTTLRDFANDLFPVVG